MKKALGLFALIYNATKQFIEKFYQIGIVVLYEFIWQSLQVYTKVVMDNIVEKI